MMMTKANPSRWKAVARRDASADGSFCFAVKTTGIYCRPSCPARRPKRENVEFFDSPDRAERAGYRACRRCDPRGASANVRNAQLVARACRMIDGSYDPPSLDSLAEHVGLSPFHFHRIFKSVTGLTPRAYAATQDARPKRRASNIRFATAECLLGQLLVAATDKGVCWISLGKDENAMLRELRRQFPKATLSAADKSFGEWIGCIVGFVDRPSQSLNLPLDIQGTAFQQRVWKALREIPFGTTMTYTQLAKKLGMPSAIRAVARACATNPISLAIPCHRVVRTDGSLAGYRWGIERKKTLIERERAS
jgi:AraC family transcriptional regulator of adaptative response/methylated-DNA-[protein]-cysteine methyltransferase